MNCCEDMDDDDKKKCFCGVCGGIVVILIICLSMGWDTVEPLEYGLKCNSVSKKCDVEEVYSGGRYFVGFFNYFINYPSNYQTIQFSAISGSNGKRIKFQFSKGKPLNTRTAEGLALSLSLSFQYKLIKKKIPDLYFMTKNYEDTFQRIARDIILQAAGDYAAPAYWDSRESIQQDMFKSLEKELKQVYCQLIAFQILVIDLPDSYESSIVQTQMNKTIRETNANGTAQAYVIEQNAVAEAANLLIDSESAALQNIKKLLGVNADQLNQYLFNLAMMEQQPKYIVGLDNVMINLEKGG